MPHDHARPAKYVRERQPPMNRHRMLPGGPPCYLSVSRERCSSVLARSTISPCLSPLSYEDWYPPTGRAADDRSRMHPGREIRNDRQQGRKRPGHRFISRKKPDHLDGATHLSPRATANVAVERIQTGLSRPADAGARINHRNEAELALLSNRRSAQRALSSGSLPTPRSPRPSDPRGHPPLVHAIAATSSSVVHDNRGPRVPEICSRLSSSASCQPPATWRIIDHVV